MTVRTMHTQETRMARLAAGLTEVLAMHTPTEMVTGDITCEECGACAPCPTSRVATRALQEAAQ